MRRNVEEEELKVRGVIASPSLRDLQLLSVVNFVSEEGGQHIPSYLVVRFLEL